MVSVQVKDINFFNTGLLQRELPRFDNVRLRRGAGFPAPNPFRVDNEVVLDGVGEPAEGDLGGTVHLGGVDGVDHVLLEDVDDGAEIGGGLVGVDVADGGGAEDDSGHG